VASSVASPVLQTADRTSTTRVAECPKCNQSVACIEADAVFDCHGLESYKFSCTVCETPFDGIVDPFDDALLLSVSGEPKS
jgi:hypothetical protein